MAAFDSSDRSRRLREESLNTLEGFIYRTRDLLPEESFITASTEIERSELQQKLGATAEWLYDEGANAERDELKARLKELRSLVDPVERRKEEAIKRPKAVELLKEALEQTKTLAAAVREQIEKSKIAATSSRSSIDAESSAASSTSDDFADLEDATSSISTTTTSKPSPSPEPPPYTSEDATSLEAVYNSVEQWLSTKMVEQDKISPQENPVLLSADLEAKSKELNQAVMGMLQRQMRKPSKPKSSSKASTKSKKGNSGKSSSVKSSSESSTTSAQGQANSQSAKGNVPQGDGPDAAGSGKASPSKHDEL